MSTYKIIRFHKSGFVADLIGGLTLEKAKEWCADKESSSSTCEEESAIAHTKEFGEWFDGFKKEEE